MSTVYWPSRNPVVTEEAGTRGGTHAGIDLRAKLNDPVIASFDGTAVYVGGDGASGRIWLGNRWLYPNGQGKTVDIRRKDGLISRVGHLNGYAVKQGQKVKAGQVIGYAGTTGYSTGVHIHWELRWDRAWVGGNWINPRTLKPRIYAPPPPPINRSNEMVLIMYRDAAGKNKPRWLVFGSPKGLVLTSKANADRWIKALGKPAIVCPSASAWKTYLKAARP